MSGGGGTRQPDPCQCMQMFGAPQVCNQCSGSRFKDRVISGGMGLGVSNSMCDSAAGSSSLLGGRLKLTINVFLRDIR